MITSAELRASALSTCLSNEPRFASPHTAYLQRDRDRQRATRQQVVRLDDCLEVEVRDDFVLAGLRREQLRDARGLVPRHAHEERDWVDDVEDELEHEHVDSKAEAVPQPPEDTDRDDE